LAKNGYDIFGVHLDLRVTLPNAQAVIKEIEETGREAVFFNKNATDPEVRKAVIGEIAQRTGTIQVFLHSLAFGTLLPFIGEDPKSRVSQRQMEMTLDVMANSLVYWVQDLLDAELLWPGGHLFAMTSAGSTRVIKSYGAVSAAKAALESHVRQLAYELAPRQITVNAVRAGVTDTPSLRRIPEGTAFLEQAQARNPSGRATTPADIAKAIVAFSTTDLGWMTGNVIGVDGGEDITA
jgi:enoyl-[acyl-carrier-protein] reductase (NADH)